MPRPILLVLLLVTPFFAGCMGQVDRDDVSFPVVSKVAGVPPGADGQVEIQGADGLRVAPTANGSALEVGLGQHVRTRGNFQACIEVCDPVDLASGMLIAEGSLLSFNNLSLNADGPETNAFIFFHDRGDLSGQYFGWADAADQFEVSDDLVAGGNVSSNGWVGSTTTLVLGNDLVPIRSAAVEGTEALIVLRGGGRLTGGAATVAFPPAFAGLVGDGPMTAQVSLTSRGPALFIAEKTKTHLRIETADGSPSEATFDYVVHAPRKGQEAFRAV